jgi:hypothetical protein
MKCHAYFFNDKTLCLRYGLLGEHSIEDIFALLGLFVGEEAKGGSVLVETVVECGFFIPSILVVVDVMIGLRVGEVQLFTGCYVRTLSTVYNLCESLRMEGIFRSPHWGQHEQFSLFVNCTQLVL